MCDDEFRTPPMELIELAVDPRRNWYLLLGLKSGKDSVCGNGYWDGDEADCCDAKLSIDLRGAGDDISPCQRRCKSLYNHRGGPAQLAVHISTETA